MVKIGLSGGMAQRPVGQLAKPVFQYGRKAEAVGFIGWVVRQASLNNVRSQYELILAVCTKDGRCFVCLPVVLLPIIVKTIRRPFTGWREIEFAVSILLFNGDESLKAGVSPKAIDGAGGLHLRNEQLADFTEQFIPQGQVAVLIVRFHANKQRFDGVIRRIGMVDKTRFGSQFESLLTDRHGPARYRVIGNATGIFNECQKSR
jgi:hypothetical protein